MYNIPNPYSYPNFFNAQMYNMYQYYCWLNYQTQNIYQKPFLNDQSSLYDFDRPVPPLKDYGPNPFVIDISEATEQNNTFRTVLWTGNNLQATLMSINVGDDIGVEVHQGDQFIRIEEGNALVRMGDSQDFLDFQRNVSDGSAIMIPAGKWHNIINMGNESLKLYAIYAPPEHPRSTVHQTKEDAEADENRYPYY